MGVATYGENGDVREPHVSRERSRAAVSREVFHRLTREHHPLRAVVEAPPGRWQRPSEGEATRGTHPHPTLTPPPARVQNRTRASKAAAAVRARPREELRRRAIDEYKSYLCNNGQGWGMR